jgi:hypothetical protein
MSRVIFICKLYKILYKSICKKNLSKKNKNNNNKKKEEEDRLGIIRFYVTIYYGHLDT